MKNIITYGTFDTLHFGLIRLLQRAKSLGDCLIVGLSSDEFNVETDWGQKSRDVVVHQIDISAMGDDWKGEFDFLTEFRNVHFLSCTPAITTGLLH